jgi:hypothetical protein
LELAKILEKTKLFLSRRQQAYRFVFSQESEYGKLVLRDLANFCRAQDSAFHADPRAHALLEGRREVWLRIEKHLNLDQQTLWKTYGRKDLE